MHQLDKLIKDRSLDAFLDKSDKLRFLYGSGWNLSETAKTIEDHMQWKQDWPSYKLIYPLITHILNSGGLYIHGRDHRYRPIIVITPKKLIDFPQHLIMASAFFILEYIKENMFLPGQIENWILIIDVQGFDFKDFPKKMITELLTHFPCRLAKAFIFNSNKFVTNILKLFSPNTFYKAIIVSEGKNSLLEICNPQQVELKFGGIAENLDDFWPPVPISSNYNAANDPIEGFLSAYSSYDEYFSLNPPKGYSDISSLWISQNEEYKESFISNSEFRDEIWQKLDIVSGSFSFLQTDFCGKMQESEPETQTKRSDMRGKSEDMTRASSNVAKKLSIEQELVETSCCVEYFCLIQ